MATQETQTQVPVNQEAGGQVGQLEAGGGGSVDVVLETAARLLYYAIRGAAGSRVSFTITRLCDLYMPAHEKRICTPAFKTVVHYFYRLLVHLGLMGFDDSRTAKRFYVDKGTLLWMWAKSSGLGDFVDGMREVFKAAEAILTENGDAVKRRIAEIARSHQVPLEEAQYPLVEAQQP